MRVVPKNTKKACLPLNNCRDQQRFMLVDNLEVIVLVRTANIRDYVAIVGGRNNDMCN